MDKQNRKNLIGTLFYALLLLLTLTLVLKFGAPKEETPETVGFITPGNTDASGWSAINCQGIQAACQNMGVGLLLRDEIPEGDGSCLQAVQELSDEGAGMIILNSYGYSREMKDRLDQYPDITFFGSSADYDAPNLISYSTRMYQARYLSGIVAGAQTKNGKIGFVAADRKIEICRGINAFTLGVQRVNPEAEVIVAWTGTWDDEETETAVAEALIRDEGVDVLTYHQDRPYVIRAAEKAGIYSIGYYEAIEDASDRYLTCVICDWTPLYEELIKEYMRGQKVGVLSDWLGLESGVVHLNGYSSLVPQSTRDEVEKATQEILSGQDVFTGLIYDNEGNLLCNEGEAMSDNSLLYNMDWLAKGVRVYAKKD